MADGSGWDGSGCRRADRSDLDLAGEQRPERQPGALRAGRGVGEHINDDVDVIFVGVSGTGSVLTNGEERRLSAGTLVLVGRGARRSILSSSEDFCYLTIHRRRGPLRIESE